MKIRIRSVLAGAAAFAVATGIMLAGGTAAFAAVTPGFEPDPNALGTLTFYDATGAVVTGGSLTSHPTVAYAAASGPGRTGDNKAQLYAYTPQVGVPTASWTGDVLTGSTTYPNTTAPAPVKNLTVPVASGTSGDISISDYITELPNSSTVSGYQNIYELRLYTSGPGAGQGTTYYRVDIQVDSTAGTWTVVFPAPATPTTTSLTASPASPQQQGTAVTLTATVNPKAAGSVHFFDGATDLGAGSYNATTGVATLSVTPAVGTHSFTAQFTSSDPAFAGSTASAMSYTITTPKTATSTTLTTSPASPATANSSGNASVTLTSTTTTASPPAGGLAGSVHFFDGSTDLGAGAYTQSTGVATLSVTLTVAGSPHQLVATFTPTDTTFASSTSAIVSFTVLPSNFGTAGIPLNAQDNTQPFAGSLSLIVAPGTKVDLVQVDPTTAAGHPVQSTDPTGHRHAWVFNGGLSGVSVNDTRPNQFGWTVTGQASDFVNGSTVIQARNLGWTPALASGGDAEGTLKAGPAVSPYLQSASSNGLAAPGTNLAQAPAGNGLGTQNLSAQLALWIPDTSPTGLYASTLTLTLISP